MPLEVRAVLALSNGNLTKEGWGSVDGNTLPASTLCIGKWTS